MSMSQRGIRWATQGTLMVLASLLFFIDLFLPWSQRCSSISVQLPGPRTFSPFPAHPTAFDCLAQTGGWGGAGTVAGVLVGLLFLWEMTRVARLYFGLGTGYRSLISSALAFGVLIFAVINVVALLTWGAQAAGSLVYGGTFLWISLALALLIGLGGVGHWRIWDEYGPAPAVAGEPAPGPSPVAPEVPPAPTGVCPKCGHVNSEDARFCSACGSDLAQPPVRRRSTRRTPPAS
jgi:hypothetical protein